MSERIRNAVFNSLIDKLPDATVMDAFAGSGGVGIEALSRGAKSCLFIERDHTAARIIQANLDLLGANDEGRVVSATINNWLSTADPVLFDIIFADPPYHDTQLNTVMKLFMLLEPGGCVIVSLPTDQELPLTKGIKVLDERIYGNAKIITAAMK